ncbi:hypothetical protein FNF27_07740 [Cafeteria roenbergensis]|uniref:Transglycosylase SLT domain-containing protein n=2 Tax=Cafeteria roenbergensis TaxID=33653 RepID=A0A5A8D0Y1_CAFRO|nr:hypothetical protein FNF29_08139 [Cafeteria roenbergensis]KAA0159006.1 hypothetical protein FNF31_05069 [Cafeteria roenbergensis]KAA0160869.1 hypothetical protein FNF28_05291 [Cafeteria roenbergensis]KAA0164958.1 hypothetical protein FNF27_07740 [Cafeteria roenbergensis]|eukprot:KAA0146268.1 hypothetical protein FNF29_08139 [Cafeteria roenbergensis]
MRVASLLLALAALVVAVSAGTRPANATDLGTGCGGNCPGGCSKCPCGESSHYVSIADWCAKHSWDQKACRCIVSHESGGNANAVNENSNGSFDVGLWQVNSMNWKACSGGRAPCDVETNLKCAIDVYRWGGNTFKLWSTCHVCGVC